MPYSISIDAIDLKYLPITNYSQKKKKTKLFNLCSAKNHDYVEFEIFASKANDETNTGTICQICNITIPACYITEHNQSIKHKMYKSITDNALERVKKYLNEDNYVSDTKKLPDSYFCDVCCLAVLESETEIHEKSQSHCKALKREKQLQDLLHLYSVTLFAAENEEDLFEIDDCNSFSAAYDDDIGKSEAKFVLNFNDSEVKKGEDEIKSIAEPEIELKLSRRAKKRAKKRLNRKVNSKRKEDDDVAGAKAITDVEPITPEEILEQPSIIVPDGIELLFTDGSIVSVFEYQYYGFINSDDITICLLCNELVRNTAAHKETSETHLRIMKIHIKDNNCIRQISNNFNHCIICNQIFADVDAHLDSTIHLSKKQRAIGEDQNGTNSIFEHMWNSEMESESKIENHFPNYYQFEIGENISHCKVCKVNVLNSLDVAQQHIGTKFHDDKYEDILQSNGLTCWWWKENGFNFSCKCCKIDGIPMGSELDHILTASHVDVCKKKRTSKSFIRHKQVH